MKLEILVLANIVADDISYLCISEFGEIRLDELVFPAISKVSSICGEGFTAKVGLTLTLSN